MHPAHHSSGIITTTVEVARVRNFEGEVFKSNRKGKTVLFWFQRQLCPHSHASAMCPSRH